uniref:Uncharacterized protein n=1 Tax=Sus scrofa TaxID=9823 RepID=A0A4X1UD41_PIG
MSTASLPQLPGNGRVWSQGLCKAPSLSVHLVSSAFSRFFPLLSLCTPASCCVHINLSHPPRHAMWLLVWPFSPPPQPWPIPGNGLRLRGEFPALLQGEPVPCLVGTSSCPPRPTALSCAMGLPPQAPGKEECQGRKESSNWWSPRLGLSCLLPPASALLGCLPAAIGETELEAGASEKKKNDEGWQGQKVTSILYLPGSMYTISTPLGS